MKKLIVFLLILISCSTLSAEVKFEKVWIEHDVVRDGIRGIIFHSKFVISGYLNRDCNAYIFIEHPKGTYHKDTNGRYASAEGHVTASIHFKPSYANSQYDDLKIFIPLEELHLLPGKYTYYSRVWIHDGKNYIANSEYVSFDGTGSSNSSNRQQPQQNRQAQRTKQQWVERLDYGMIDVYEGDPHGAKMCTRLRPCPACRGLQTCGVCAGTGKCGMCYGLGYYNVGYSMPCNMCAATGRCTTCGGSGKCACSQMEYPGYMPYAVVTFDANGNITSNTSYNSLSGNDSRSSRSSSPSRSTCPKCGGRKFDLETFSYATGTAIGWALPHFNRAGVECQVCKKHFEHYHYPCPECRGYGYISR